MQRDKKAVKLDNKSMALTTIHQSNDFVRTLEYISEKDKLSNVEMTLLHFAMANIMNGDKEFKEIALTGKEMEQYIGVNLSGSNKNNWIHRFESLIDKKFVYESEDRLIVGVFFQYCDYDKKNNLYKFRLNSRLEEALLQLSHTGHNIFLLGWSWGLSSSAKTLYSIANSVKGIVRNKLYYPIEKLKKVLGYFQEGTGFVRDCLRPTVNEVNEKTDINIAVTPVKQGKKIVAYVLECAGKTVSELNEKGINPSFPNENDVFEQVARTAVQDKIRDKTMKNTVDIDSNGAFQPPVQDIDLYKRFPAKEITHIADAAPRSEYKPKKKNKKTNAED